MALWLRAGLCGTHSGVCRQSCAGLHAFHCPTSVTPGDHSHLHSRSQPCRRPQHHRRPAVASQRATSEVQLPPGFHYYETMLVLRPDMTDQERDMELAKFEAYLKQDDARDIVASIKAGQRLAYPIKGFWQGVYVLYTYAAKSATAQGVQKLLSKPRLGDEQNILRHMTYKS